jgi:hypothetical protein
MAADPEGGQWLAWPGAVDPAVAGRPDGAYLFPISRELNPSFKGVIFVEGKVAISGVLRGRVTVAATDDIVIVDDLTYSVDPGAGTCRGQCHQCPVASGRWESRPVPDVRRHQGRVHSRSRLGPPQLLCGELRLWSDYRRGL